MRARLTECGAPSTSVMYARSVSAVCLDETFFDTTGGSAVFFTYGGMIAHALTYAAHRRTLVTGALYSSGTTDLEDDPLPWEPVRPGGPTAP